MSNFKANETSAWRRLTNRVKKAYKSACCGTGVAPILCKLPEDSDEETIMMALSKFNARDYLEANAHPTMARYVEWCREKAYMKDLFKINR